MEFTTTVASLIKPNTSYGKAFSPEALDQIANQCKDKPIYLEFDRTKSPIGIIYKGKVKGDKVEVEGELLRLSPREGYIVPEYNLLQSHHEGRVLIHTDIRVDRFVLTQKPIDTSLISITRREGGVSEEKSESIIEVMQSIEELRRVDIFFKNHPGELDSLEKSTASLIALLCSKASIDHTQDGEWHFSDEMNQLGSLAVKASKVGFVIGRMYPLTLGVKC